VDCRLGDPLFALVLTRDITGRLRAKRRHRRELLSLILFASISLWANDYDLFWSQRSGIQDVRPISQAFMIAAQAISNCDTTQTNAMS
jgi:hypothetical protein